MQAPSKIQGDPLAQSEDYISDISPLNQGLGGTTGMPILDQFQIYNNSTPISTQYMNNFSIALEPQEQALFLANEHSTHCRTTRITQVHLGSTSRLISTLEMNMVL
jgi:hypothetical protein